MLNNIRQVLINLAILISTVVYRELSDIQKGLQGNFRWFCMRKIARFNTGQHIVKFFRKKSKSLANEYGQETISNSVFNGVDIDDTIDQLSQNGIYVGLTLPKHIVNKITEYAYHTPCYANGCDNLGFYYSEKEKVLKENQINLIIGDYYNTSRCDTIQKISTDPVLMEISRRYFNSEAVYQGHKLWWSFPNDLNIHHQFKYGQTFHYDIDDYSALKFFFYLTDVHTSSGPHVCVLGSHNSKKFLHKLLRGYWPDDTIIKSYKKENIKTIYSQSGEGFVEDTFCLHKGTPPEHEDRLILVIEYAIYDYGMQHNIKNEKLLKFID